MKILTRRICAFVKLSLLELWRRNDMVTLGVLAAVLLVPLSLARPFGAAGATRYFDEAALLLVWAYSLFLSLGIGGRLFANEFSSKTIYPLLAKPVSRTEVLLGKYISAVFTTCSALLLFYLIFIISALIRGADMSIICLLQAFILHSLAAALIVALAVCMSFLASPSMSATVCAVLFPVMFFFGRKLPIFAHEAIGPTKWVTWLFYWIAPHVEFFDMRQRVVHGWGAIDLIVFIIVCAYAVTYISILLLTTSSLFRRKRL